MAQFTLPINSIVKKGKTFESKSLPKNQLCVEVYRYDPELKSNPRVDTYILDKDKFGPMALDVLIYIKNRIAKIHWLIIYYKIINPFCSCPNVWKRLTK